MDTRFISDTVESCFEDACYRSQDAILLDAREHHPFEFDFHAKAFLACSYLEAYVFHADELAGSIIAAMQNAFDDVDDDPKLVRDNVCRFLRVLAEEHVESDIGLLDDLFRERLSEMDLDLIAVAACRESPHSPDQSSDLGECLNEMEGSCGTLPTPPKDTHFPDHADR